MQSFSMSFHITFQNETLTTMTVEMFLCAVYSLTCLFKLICPLNAFPQTEHTKQFRPDCIIRISHTVPSVSESLLTCCTFVCFVTTMNVRMKVKYGLTFIIRGSYSVFGFTLLSFPLNRCACLTISVYIL